MTRILMDFWYYNNDNWHRVENLNWRRASKIFLLLFHHHRCCLCCLIQHWRRCCCCRRCRRHPVAPAICSRPVRLKGGRHLVPDTQMSYIDPYRPFHQAHIDWIINFYGSWVLGGDKRAAVCIDCCGAMFCPTDLTQAYASAPTLSNGIVPWKKNHPVSQIF